MYEKLQELLFHFLTYVICKYVLLLSDGKYTNWHQNEPREEEDGTFVVLSWSRGRWGWRSRLGHDYKHYICEANRDEGE